MKIFLITLTIVIMASIVPTASAEGQSEGDIWIFTYQWSKGTTWNSEKPCEYCWLPAEKPNNVMNITYLIKDNLIFSYYDKNSGILSNIDSNGNIQMSMQGSSVQGILDLSAGTGSGAWFQKELRNTAGSCGVITTDCSGIWTAVVEKKQVIENNKDSNGLTTWDDNLTEEDFLISDTKPNTYETIKVNDSPDVIKFVDIYGKEQYTTDGKHYYDSYGKAVKPGIKGLINKAKDIIGDFKDFFFKTKYKDKDKQLRNDIAREVLKDFKSKKEKKLDKIHEKYVKAMGDAPGLLGKYASVPADAILTFNNEASETDFAQGAEYYFQERDDGKSSEQIYDTPPEEIEYGVGALTHDKYPKAVLYTKYEEVYQKYKLAKQLGRK